MRIPRFFVPAETITDQDKITLSDRNLVDQISKVLRLKTGDQIDLLDGKGKIYRCTISLLRSGRSEKSPSVETQIENEFDAGGESSVSVSIALPILRPSRFEWALEKLTELGVAEIVPLVTTRSVGREEKSSRWKSIVREAAEQCERAVIPEVVAPMELKEYFKHLSGDRKSSIFICAERSEGDAPDNRGASPLHMVLCNFEKKAPHKISVIVGAEGGFTSEELDYALNAGAMPVSLGKRILRSETAAVYTLAVVQSILD